AGAGTAGGARAPAPPAGRTAVSRRVAAHAVPRAPTGDVHALVPLPADVDVRRTVGRLRRGAGDPTWVHDADGTVWHAVRRPTGTATLRLRPVRGGVRVDAWGAGAAQALADAPGLLGALDDPRGFADHLHPAVARARRTYGGVRLARSGDVWDAVVTAVLEQRVVGLDAQASWRRLVAAHGEPAPGPAPARLRVAPPPGAWATLPVWEWRRAGVDAQRSDTVRRAARVAHALSPALDPDELARRLRTVPGIGPWTVAEVTSRALGDPDAVSVGDAHLCHLVGWALTGRRADDAGMLRLLEPWRGHRQRVLVLLELAYRGGMPAYGPRAPRARALV
ncbi:DNA-3-methyladenine glycosylase family protein, partial [Cellulomonas shaoxiangyii]